MAITPTLQHRFLATVTFHGFDNTSRTIKFSGSDGGDLAGETTTIRPGGMDKGIKLGGLVDRDDGNWTKPYDLAADPDNETWLEQNINCPVDALLQPLGANKLPVGTGRTKTGICTGVQGPKSDATSNDGPQLGVTLAFDE